MKLCNEITLLRALAHDNIVKFLGTRLDQKQPRLYIIMELVSGGSVAQILREYGALPEPLIRNYTRQVNRNATSQPVRLISLPLDPEWARLPS